MAKSISVMKRINTYKVTLNVKMVLYFDLLFFKAMVRPHLTDHIKPLEEGSEKTGGTD